MTGVHWADALVGILIWVGMGVGVWVNICLSDRHEARLQERQGDPFLPKLWECSCGVIGRAATRQQAHDDYMSHGREAHPYPAVNR